MRSNTPFDSNEPLELRFKEPKSKHIIYNFFELIIHYAIIAPFLVICGDFSILRGARHQNFILNLKFATRMQSGHCIDAVIRSGISKFYTAPLAKRATLIIF